MSGFDSSAVLDALETMLPSDRPLQLHEPLFEGNEWKYVKDCLDSGWVSYAGSYVTRFEEMMAEITGTKHGVAVVNGTVALHMALELIGLKRGDEVLAPALTFIATINAISHAGGIPHLVDSEPGSLGLDPAALARHLEQVAEKRGSACFNKNTGRRIAAVMPMHVFGHPVDMDAVNILAEEWGLVVVEDAAEAIGSRYKGRPAGGFGRLAGFSFNGNKITTTGGGGVIVTDDPDLAKRAKHLTTTAKKPHAWAFEHDEIGYNFRLPNLNAALGCAQLEQLEQRLEKKRRLARRYTETLSGLAGVEMVRPLTDAVSNEEVGNYWLNAVLVPDRAARDQFLTEAHARGLMMRPAWGLMHHQPVYAECPRADLKVAEDLEARLVCLPSTPNLVD